jgi:hypothetical protein
MKDLEFFCFLFSKHGELNLAMFTIYLYLLRYLWLCRIHDGRSCSQPKPTWASPQKTHSFIAQTSHTLSSSFCSFLSAKPFIGCPRPSAVRLVWARIARFFLKQQTKNIRMYSITTNYTKGAMKSTKWSYKYSKWTENIQTFSVPRPSKIYQKWDFRFANIPSGNPGVGAFKLS